MSDYSAFLSRQLEHIRTKVFEKRYPAMLSRTFVPPSPDPAPDGKNVILYATEDRTGAAKILAPGSRGRDLPLVNISVSEESQNVRDCGVAFDYSVGELMAAMQAGVDLTGKKAFAARKASEQLIDEILATGDSAHGLKGFINHSAVNADPGASGKAWDAASAEEILEDLNEPCRLINTQTKGSYGQGLDVILSLEDYNIAATKRIPDLNETVLSFFLRTQPLAKSVSAWYKLTGKGESSKNRMVVYQRDPEVLNYEMPCEFTMLEPQAQGLSYVVPCRLVTAGVIVHQPKAIEYRDLGA